MKLTGWDECAPFTQEQFEYCLKDSKLVSHAYSIELAFQRALEKPMTTDNPNTSNSPAAQYLAEDSDANDIIRQILVESLVRLLPVLIERYLTNEMIEKLIRRGLSRIDEA